MKKRKKFKVRIQEIKTLANEKRGLLTHHEYTVLLQASYRRPTKGRKIKAKSVIKWVVKGVIVLFQFFKVIG